MARSGDYERAFGDEGRRGNVAIVEHAGAGEDECRGDTDEADRGDHDVAGTGEKYEGERGEGVEGAVEEGRGIRAPRRTRKGR